MIENATVMLAGSPCVTTFASCVTQFITTPTNIWFPLFTLAIGMVLAILVVIYALSPLLGRNDIKTWVRIKIYELLLTLVIALVFVSFSSLLYTTNLVPVYGAVGIVPNACNPSNPSASPPTTNVGNVYSLALCDMYQFNQDVSSFSQSLFYMSLLGGISPVYNIHPEFLDSGPADLAQALTSPAYPGVGFSFSIQLLPIQIVHQYIVPYMNAFFGVVILSEMQQILLSASMIIFSTLIIIGFFARAFSITKTFGGAMIAFGLGFGFIYPLIVSISYGFLDVAIENTQFFTTNLFLTFAINLAPDVISLLLSGGCTPSATAAVCNPSAIPGFTQFLLSGGFVGAGLLLIPLLNLVIVDAFIVDTSRVIGERIDLMSLLTRIL